MKSIFTNLLIAISLFLFSNSAFSQKKLVSSYSERLINGSFQAYDSVLYEYDSNNKQAAWWSQYYDETTSTWKRLLRFEYTYNTNGDIATILVKLWSNNNWIENNLDTYIYDNNLLKTINRTRWYNNQWNNTAKTEYFYSNLNQPDSTIYYSFTNGSFKNTTKNIFNYDANEDITEDMQYSWNGDLASWIISYRSRYLYNSQKLNIKTIIEQKAQLGWSTLNEELKSYDSDKDIRTINVRNNNGIVTLKRVNFYDSPATGIADILSDKIKLYPNPTSNTLNLDLDVKGNYVIDIINTTGKQVYSTTIEGIQNKIDVSSFNQGVYFYTLKNADNGHQTMGKFIIAR